VTAGRPRRRQGGDSRVGTALVVVGCLGALGAAFGVGTYTGWYWARSSQLAAEKAVAKPVRPAPPALTFYQELTAPLGVSPAPARPPAAERRGERPGGREERASRSDRRPEAGLSGYTVQVGAYRDRASAEALRASVAASGHEAYVVEVDGPSGAARYRVRVGSFASREAATAAAGRLERDGQRSAYVTSR
jgi:cell division protein FtsN